MPVQTRYIDEKIPMSITSDAELVTAVDSSTPLSFQEWLKYNKSLFTDADDFLSRYQSYLNNWYEIKNIAKPEREKATKSFYTALISEIILSFSTSDEKRFLKNIDFNNKRELAIAVPFFAKKIKDICLYYSTLRDEVGTATIRYNLKGSVYGTEKLLYNQISKSLEAQDLVELIDTLNLSLSDIRDNMVIDIEELYDTCTNYLDISPKTSAYNVDDIERNQNFAANQYDINEKLFLNFNSCIVDAITSYPFYLLEFGTNNFTIDYTNVDSTNLQLLKDTDYTSTVNDKQKTNLNLNIIKAGIEKYIGTDFYFLSTNATNTSFLSGKLFTAESEFANYLNKRYPTVAAIPSSEFVKSPKEIGLFFKPDKLGLTNAFSFGQAATVEFARLSADTVYIFPDPKKYGNISGLTQKEFETPLVFSDIAYFNKIDSANQYMFGDSISNNYFQIFRAYQAREQSLNSALHGLSRYTDSQEFFEGYKKNIWSNHDVYPIIPQNVFPIDNRTEKLYSIDKTAVQYKSDIYGNEYVLYKDVHPPKIPTDDVTLRNYRNARGRKKTRYCQIIDGHTFYDIVSGFYFDFSEYNQEKGYSGITLKTSDNIPPGKGYYIHGGPDGISSSLSASYYSLGPPSFYLASGAKPIISYRFNPEIFNSEFISITFDCNTADAQTFVSANSGLLPDFSSDNPAFNSSYNVYYTDLLDGGVNLNSPTQVPNNAFAGNFLQTVGFSAMRNIDGFKFVYNGNSPCGEDNTISTAYTEKTNYMNYHIPLRDTKTLTPRTTSITTKRTLYETNFIDYGDLYFRNTNSSLIAPVSSALSAVLIKYSPTIQNEIINQLINFDIIGDIIVFETENYTVIDRVVFDHSTARVTNTTKNDSYITRGQNQNLEKISTTWYDEKENKIFLCKTILFNTLSATNNKIIYPEIYVFDLNDITYKKIYPRSFPPLTYDYLKKFSLSGTNVDVNIIEIEKPIFSYNEETNTYTLSWIGRDPAQGFYIFKSFFKYVNSTITNTSNSMFKFMPDVKTINFTQPSLAFSTLTIIGNSPSTSSTGEYIF